MLKEPFSPRLLKKVQMQGGAGCAGVPTEDGSPQMGLFERSVSRKGTWEEKHGTPP
jgi:hypothetical protein